jgi:hypothetical protein
VLFDQLVAAPGSLPFGAYGTHQPNILVLLRGLDFAPIMINREVDTEYWDHPIVEITKDAQLSFVRFFDWDVLGGPEMTVAKRPFTTCGGRTWRRSRLVGVFPHLHGRLKVTCDDWCDWRATLENALLSQKRDGVNGHHMFGLANFDCRNKSCGCYSRRFG